MTESKDRQGRFFGTYFERDSVLQLARWADIAGWAVLVVYVISWVFSILLYISQYYNGMFFEKGMTFLMVFSMLKPYFLEPWPGVFYFFALQGISKGLLLMLDVEDNSRRSARK